METKLNGKDLATARYAIVEKCAMTGSGPSYILINESGKNYRIPIL